MEVFYRKGQKVYKIKKDVAIWISLAYLSYHEEITLDEVVMSAKEQGFIQKEAK